MLKTSFALALAAVIVVVQPHSALAAAGATFGGPLGATDINNAYLPPEPGVFVGFANILAYADRAYDNQEKSAPVAFHAGVYATYLGYEYPFTVLGGRLASGIQGAYSAPASLQIENATPDFRATGWNDIYVDFLNWSRYIGPLFGERTQTLPGEHAEPVGLTAKVEYSMIFPIGAWEADRPLNLGSHTFFIIPNFALTYLTNHDALGGGVEFDVHMFYDHQTTNPLNQYESGDVIDTDFAVAQRLGKWMLGATGSYAFQLQNDYSGPNHLIVDGTGDKIKALIFGPIVQRSFPKYHAFIKTKATFPLVTRNTLGLTSIVTVVGFTF